MQKINTDSEELRSIIAEGIVFNEFTKNVTFFCILNLTLGGKGLIDSEKQMESTDHLQFLLYRRVDD